MEMSVPSQESQRSFMCVYRLCLFLQFFYWILEPFRQCGILCFSLKYFNIKLYIVFNEFISLLGKSLFKIFQKHTIL